jgi:hypothetical protein
MKIAAVYEHHAGERRHRPLLQRDKYPDSLARGRRARLPTNAWLTFKQALENVRGGAIIGH